jgi:hypothetical protein
VGGTDGQILPPGIKKNMTTLAMFAALVAGGVEMRISLKDVHDDGVALAQELREHEHKPNHDGDRMVVETAVQAAAVDDIKRRLGKLEDGQEQTQRAVMEVLREVQAIRKDK